MNKEKSTTEPIRKRYSNRRWGKKVPQHLGVLNPDAAGIDLGAETHYVSVPEDRDPQPIRHFGCYTAQLEDMAKWLVQCHIKTVVMEATGVYWTPVYRVLEEYGLEVLLVNPRHVKYVPGRKTDVADCQWLRQLHSYGLLRGAFVPPQTVDAMRTYWRQRKELVQCASREILHVQKAMIRMNIHLHVVISDITGLSGMKILRAILAGQRDPVELAKLANHQCKNSREKIAQALTGHYTAENLFVLKQSLDTYDYFQSKIRECDQHLAGLLAQFQSKADPNILPARSQKRRKNQPYFDLRAELYRIAAVDLTRVDGIDAMTAFSVLSEIGFEVSKFPTEDQFVSWLGLCPNNTITGGKVKRRGTKRVKNRAADALRVAAQSLSRSQSYLGGIHRRFRAHLGPAEAITATAHKLARIIYRLLKFGEAYVDKGEQYLEKQHRNRMLKGTIRNARQLGLALINIETGECFA